MSAFGIQSNTLGTTNDFQKSRKNDKYESSNMDSRKGENSNNRRRFNKHESPFPNELVRNANDGSKRNSDKRKFMGQGRKGGRDRGPPHNKGSSGLRGNNMSADENQPSSMAVTEAFSEQDIQLIGPLIEDPTKLGFRKGDKMKPRAISSHTKVTQLRSLKPFLFSQDEWDRKNQEKMLELEAHNAGNDFQSLYEELQRMRELERKQMEKLGLVDAENTSKTLNEAIAFQGTCVDMCPVFERVRRSLENNVNSLEKDPSTSKVSRAKAVKAFSRPAAGQPPPLPSEVRPPHVLKATLDYLVDNIVPQLPEAHLFLWDRTRCIRQDFTYQNYIGPEAIDCNERIARIHLLSLHIMARSNIEYSQQQEVEQLNKTLQTLVEIYRDVRNNGGQAPNEAEFRSYYLLTHMKDSELEREVQSLPDDTFQDRRIQLALMIRSIATQNNVVERGFNNSIGALNLFMEFFKIVYSDQTPFLHACLLEKHFSEIRFYALKSMSRCYHTRGKAYSAELLQKVLGFDSLDKLLEFVQYYGIDILYDNGIPLVDLFNKEKLETKYQLNSFREKQKPPQENSDIIDLKIKNQLWQSLINSGRPNDNLHILPKESAPLIQPVVFRRKSYFNLSLDTTKRDHLKNRMRELKSSLTPSVTTSEKDYGPGKTREAADNNKNDIGGMNNGDMKKPDFSLLPRGSFLKNKSPFGMQQETNNIKNVESKNYLKPPPSERTGKTDTLISDKASSVFQQPFRAPEKRGNVIDFRDTVQQGLDATSTDLYPRITPKAAVPKKLADLPLFPQALDAVYKEIMHLAIDEELNRILGKVLQIEYQREEKRDIINIFSNQLYQAFVSELVYHTLLQLQADAFFENHVRLNCIKKLKSVGAALVTKHHLIWKKRQELSSISFNPLFKRRAKHGVFDLRIQHKRWNGFSDEDAKIEYIRERQHDVQQLWEPLDLNRFCNYCSDFKEDYVTAERTVQFLLVVENWSAPSSKWLNTKLALRINHQKRNFENIVSNEKMTLKFVSLPKSDFQDNEFFNNTTFILFECGLVDNSQVSKFASIKDKLARDLKVILKIVQLCREKGYYKLQLLVEFWDVFGSDMKREEVFSLLGLRNFENDDIVSDIVLCDMADKSSNISDTLQEAFDRIGQLYKGELSEEGRKKLLEKEGRIQHTPESKNKVPISDALFQKEENHLLKKAKRSKKYEYLTRYLKERPSLSKNSSFTESSFYPSNIDVGQFNTSIWNNNTNRPLQEAHNSINNISAFGNDVIEESTPYNSPKPRAFARPTSKNIPRNLQSLKDLTSRVKAKYQK